MSLALRFILLTHISLVIAQSCPRGTFRQIDGTCQLCAPGSFSDQPNAETCTPCSPGKFLTVTGAQTENACRFCPAGTSSAAGAAMCTPCPPGFNSQRSSQCTQCPPGTEIGFSIFSNSPECTPCPNGFSPLPNQLQCNSCPLGSAAPGGATSAEQCVRCPAGSAPAFPGCQPCGIGFFSTDGLRCRRCPVGTISIGTGNTRCEVCPPGFVGNKGRDSFESGPECLPCSNGTTTFGTASVLCRREGSPCPNTYLENSAGDCVLCAIDFFFDRNLQSCEPCSDGFGSPGGLSLQCSPCFEIINAGITSSHCSFLGFGQAAPVDENGDCPPGTYVSGQDGRTCVTCDSGTFSDTINLVGVINPITGSFGCTPCPLGFVQPRFGASECEQCPPGTEPDDFFRKCVVPQSNCELGSSRVDITPQSSACRSNTCDQVVGFEEFKGRECGLCGVGKFAPESGVCQACPANSVGDGLRCATCPEGLVRFDDQCACRGLISINRGLINGSCQVCPPGSFGEWSGDPESDSVCQKCPAGTFRVAINEEDIASCIEFSPRCFITPPCQDCPANSFTDTEGAVECKPCPPGMFSYGVGETECLVVGAMSLLKQLDDPLRETILPSPENFNLDVETPQPSVDEPSA